jgi:nucleoid-associated protein YgaU
MTSKAHIARCAREQIATSLVFCLWVLASGVAISPALALADAMPPSIEKVVVGALGQARIEGAGQPGDVVQLVSDDSELGEARVGPNGQWRVELTAGLKPGTHQIRAGARTGVLGPVVAGDEIRIAIPAELGGQAVVAYDGVTGDADRATRQRAEALADAAGEAYDEVQNRAPAADAAAAPAMPREEAAPAAGPLTVVIDWLKRSARGYREDVVSKLGVAKTADAQPEAVPDPADDKATAAAAAAETIARERAKAEASRIDLAEAETVRKAQEAEKAASAAQKKDAAKRKQADDLARRKAESDRRISEELERLKKAKEEADRAKAASGPPPQKANITLERFYLPGQKRPAAEEEPAEAPQRVARSAEGIEHPRQKRPESRASRCADGRVVHRKGRRWYVTGQDDTLWDIAERFYGSGTAYPRIYRANRKRLASPHIVRPCFALRLPGR